MSDQMSTSLDTDPVTQALFVHEYVHYVQALTGTIGRIILSELVRLSIYAGLIKMHGDPLPSEVPGPIDLRAALSSATVADFQHSDVRIQYQRLRDELRFALSDNTTPAPPGAAAGSFVRLQLTVGTHTVDRFVHIVAESRDGLVAVPLTDRVVFENMARQVQRNYLRFNNGLIVSSVDDERRKSHEDLTYVCLHDALKGRLPATEDPAKWTITLCQIALLCRNPGTAIERMLSGVSHPTSSDIAGFINVMNYDPWFNGEFNVPPVQDVLKELTSKWGSSLLLREQWELREFTKLVATSYNEVSANYSLMANSLICWSEVRGWITRFGCPPVVFSDTIRTNIHGHTTASHWTSYLCRLDDLLK